MVTLYTGVYRVALDLHRRSQDKRQKQMTSLAAMARQTVTHMGTAVIGMTRTAQLDAQIRLHQQQQVRRHPSHSYCRQRLLHAVDAPLGETDGQPASGHSRNAQIMECFVNVKWETPTL